MAIDMWSFGCILGELFTGEERRVFSQFIGHPLFPGENEQDQILCMMEVLNTPPLSLIDKSSRKKIFFGKI